MNLNLKTQLGVREGATASEYPIKARACTSRKPQSWTQPNSALTGSTPNERLGLHPSTLVGPLDSVPLFPLPPARHRLLKVIWKHHKLNPSLPDGSRESSGT